MAPKPTLNLEELHESIANIFDQAQVSLANHKKNCVALYKLHTKAAAITQPAKKGNGLRLVGEKAFQDVFIDMVNRVLVMKKGPTNADRIIKYVGSYVKFMNEKVSEEKSKTASSSVSALVENNQEDEDENATTRFVSRLLNWLLQGFLAKNKNVRFRCTQIVSEMISHLGEIDEDAYNELRSSLIQRLYDKETIIRVHVIIALSKLVGTESPDEIEKGERTILQMLLDIISIDPAPEVRRAALVNIPLVPASLDVILGRTRDVDPVTRKLVYNGVLQSKLTNPRQLSIAQREQIVKDGLGDREPGVRVAAGKLVASWFDTAMVEAPKTVERTWNGDDGGVMKGLIHFLGLFDVAGPGEAVAVDAVLSILTIRPDIPDVFTFEDDFWKELSSESVVLARVFVEHCVSTENEARLESASLPVVTAFAFHIQEAYNALLVALQDVETAKLLQAGLEQEKEQGEEEELDEELAKREIILGELLRMALKLDYSDEIGRRKVFSVVKDMLGHPQLPPGLIEHCMNVLKKIMPSERDLIRVIVEIIVELREGEDDAENADDPQPMLDDNQSDISVATTKKDKSLRKTKERDEMTPEERMESDLTDMRCLWLCIAVLERVDGSFEDNSTLEGILGDLIIPSVKRKELAMREKALASLGLCCLIAKNMALSSFQLFLSQAQNAPTELKVQVLRIILDLLIVYDQDFFSRSEDVAKRITDFLLQMLDSDDSPEVQAVLCTGICKLLLAGIITDSRVLSCLALIYISPTTKDNQELRQCLSYFFPVYSYSSPGNQNRIQKIFISTFDQAARMREDLNEDQEMITLRQFGLLMLDWTDPQKAAEIAVEDTRSQEAHAHVNLAIDILAVLYDSERSDEEQKTLCQLLDQLQIEPGMDLRDIQKINILLSYHEELSPFENTSIEKIYDRFKNRFSKVFAEELKTINPLEYLDDEFQDIYRWIGVDVPTDADYEDRSNSSDKQKAVKDAVVSDAEKLSENDEQVEDQAASESQTPHSPSSAPPPKPKKQLATRRSTRSTGSTSQSQKQEAQEECDDPQVSEEENIPAVEVETVTLTPKKKGVKRPSSSALNSPANRKKTRVKTSLIPQEESDSHASEEENIPSAETMTVTTKKKGVKRVRDPGPGALNSPANRKKTRVKGRLKSETTPTNTDIESPPTTPTKRSTRQSRSLKNEGSSLVVPESPPAASSDRDHESDDNDAAEVESMSMARSSSPSLPPSSDDFGGY